MSNSDETRAPSIRLRVAHVSHSLQMMERPTFTLPFQSLTISDANDNNFVELFRVTPYFKTRVQILNFRYLDALDLAPSNSERMICIVRPRAPQIDYLHCTTKNWYGSSSPWSSSTPAPSLFSTAYLNLVCLITLSFRISNVFAIYMFPHLYLFICHLARVQAGWLGAVCCAHSSVSAHRFDITKMHVLSLSLSHAHSLRSTVEIMFIQIVPVLRRRRRRVSARTYTNPLPTILPRHRKYFTSCQTNAPNDQRLVCTQNT